MPYSIFKVLILDFREIILTSSISTCVPWLMIISKVFEEFCSRLGHSGCETAVAEAVMVLKKTTKSLALLSYSIREEKENEVIVIKSLSGSPTIRTPFRRADGMFENPGEGGKYIKICWHNVAPWLDYGQLVCQKLGGGGLSPPCPPGSNSPTLPISFVPKSS